MSSRMCRGNKISLTLFGASSPDYHPCICVVKTKVLISCAVTAQLICVFVFAYAVSTYILSDVEALLSFFSSPLPGNSSDTSYRSHPSMPFSVTIKFVFFSSIFMNVRFLQESHK